MGLPNPTHIAVSDVIYKSNVHLVTLIKSKCYHLGMEKGDSPHNYDKDELSMMRCIAANLKILNDNLTEFVEEMRKEPTMKYFVPRKG